MVRVSGLRLVEGGVGGGDEQGLRDERGGEWEGRIELAVEREVEGWKSTWGRYYQEKEHLLDRKTSWVAQEVGKRVGAFLKVPVRSKSTRQSSILPLFALMENELRGDSLEEYRQPVENLDIQEPSLGLQPVEDEILLERDD